MTDIDGDVQVAGALVSVHCGSANEHAVYVEPNIRVRHPVPDPRG
ncbi:hypothetical protein [Embleya scabrispora]|nr:hypothetical protein [Embleya scabrispora]